MAKKMGIWNLVNKDSIYHVSGLGHQQVWPWLHFSQHTCTVAFPAKKGETDICDIIRVTSLMYCLCKRERVYKDIEHRYRGSFHLVGKPAHIFQPLHSVAWLAEGATNPLLLLIWCSSSGWTIKAQREVFLSFQYMVYHCLVWVPCVSTFSLPV